MRYLLLAGLTVGLLLVRLGQPAQSNPQNVPLQPSEADLGKIRFDLSAISSEGLIGSGNGVRALSYEFCIPATEQTHREVQTIDPSVQAFPGSRGRIGCRLDQYLCIGSTHQPRWRTVLQQLAQLDYIEQIDQFLGE
jgi:hypothetical protein